MIYVVDDFLNKDLLESTQSKLNSEEYVEHKTPGKSFWVQHPTEEFTNTVMKGLESREGAELECILAFFRVSNEDVDKEWRIHSDLNIAGQKPDRAAVLYMSPKEIDELHGTAFWDHKVYGKSLPDNTTDDEYNRMILSEAENLESWRLSSVSGYEENRLISYPANYFHSKYPKKSWASGRQVFVVFYKFKEVDKNKLSLRPLVENDYDTMCKWWSEWEWPIISKELLPNDGLGGFMVEKNGRPLVAGFVYLTNSKGAWFDMIVSDPSYREDDRGKAVELLISGAEKFCVDLGITSILHIGKNKGLMNKFNKLGWHVDEEPSYEIMKRIQ